MGQRGILPHIQMLRGAAAMAVVVHHLLEEAVVIPGQAIPGWLTMVGAAGVDLFFVISGFIMVHSALPIVRSAEGPLDFLTKRVLRIYPFYWVCLLLMAALLLSAGKVPDRATVVTSLLLLPYDDRIVWVAWTLACEMYFYLIFALCLMQRERHRVILTTIAAMVAAYLLHFALPQSLFRSFLSSPLMAEFCFGMLLGWVHGRRPMPKALAHAGWMAGCALLVAASIFFPSQTTHALPGWSRVIGWGIPAALIVGSLSNAKLQLSGESLFARLGDASYAIYLTHSFVMIQFARLLELMPGGVAPWLLMLAMIPLSAVVGLAMHEAVERPLIRWTKNLHMARRLQPA